MGELRDLPARLQRMIAAEPEAAALRYAGSVRSFAFLDAAVEGLEGVLAAAGRSGARRVGIVLRNRPGPFAALVATAATGREIVTLSPHLGDEALARDVLETAPDAVVAEPGDLGRAGLAKAAAEVGALLLEATDSEHSPLQGADGDRNPPAGPVPDAGASTAVLMLTSGTTGRPKRIPLGYAELTAAFRAGGVPLGPADPAAPDTAILWASLVHISGLYFALAHVAAGRCTALMERFEVAEWAALVRRYRPAQVGLAPTAVRMILASDLGSDALDGVRVASCGTAALDPAEADAFTARFGVPVLPVYGATEFAGAVASWTPALHEEWGTAKRGSSGRARPGVDLRVVDPDTGVERAAGEVGVLEARGSQLPGEGWIRTTDLAVVDADGFLFVRGRTDDAINRGGFTIVPSVIEDALRAHPAVADAAAVGLPDPRLGEVPVAAVALRTSVEEVELAAWLADRLPRYQLPTRIAVVAELPRTPSLKVSRPGVRELFR
jgi:acyl-CoA synthetase (AMP-forming)/AMP-acid ligase II